MAEKISLSQVRDTLASWLGGSEACLDTRKVAPLESMIAACDTHLTQPAQAVDVNAVREVAAGLLTNAADLNRIDVCPMLATHLRNAADKLTRAIGNAQAEGWSVSDDAAERLAQYIYEQEARERCKTLDESVSHRSNWRRAIPEARKMLEVALLPTPPTQATPNAHE